MTALPAGLPCPHCHTGSLLPDRALDSLGAVHQVEWSCVQCGFVTASTPPLPIVRGDGEHGYQRRNRRDWTEPPAE